MDCSDFDLASIRKKRGRILCKGCSTFFQEGNPFRTHVQNAQDTRCFSASVAVRDRIYSYSFLHSNMPALTYLFPDITMKYIEIPCGCMANSASLPLPFFSIRTLVCNSVLRPRGSGVLLAALPGFGRRRSSGGVPKDWGADPVTSGDSDVLAMASSVLAMASNLMVQVIQRQVTSDDSQM